MTTAAGCTTGFANLAGNFAQIDCRENLFTEFPFLISGVAAGAGKFTIVLSGIMTNQTINPFLRRKIKTLLFPTITCMTAGAPAPV